MMVSQQGTHPLSHNRTCNNLCQKTVNSNWHKYSHAFINLILKIKSFAHTDVFSCTSLKEKKSIFFHLIIQCKALNIAV